MAQKQIVSALKKSESPEVRFHLRQALQILQAHSQGDCSQELDGRSTSEEH